MMNRVYIASRLYVVFTPLEISFELRMTRNWHVRTSKPGLGTRPATLAKENTTPQTNAGNPQATPTPKTEAGPRR